MNIIDDLVGKILIELSSKDIRNYCMINKYSQNFWSDELFWQTKSENIYPGSNKFADSWRTTVINLEYKKIRLDFKTYLKFPPHSVKFVEVIINGLHTINDLLILIYSNMRILKENYPGLKLFRINLKKNVYFMEKDSYTGNLVLFAANSPDYSINHSISPNVPLYSISMGNSNLYNELLAFTITTFS